MKKVGLITFHKYHNYGGVLQAYATFKTINKFAGYETEFINYYKEKNFAVWNHRLSEIGLKANSYKYLPYKLVYFNKIKNRYIKFEDFINKHFKLSKYYCSNSEMKNKLDYDIYVSGSDQIWSQYFEFSSPENTIESHKTMLPYYLAFTESQNKIAYASSMGDLLLLPLNNKYYLTKYKKILTREKKQAKFLGKWLGRTDIEQVVDPTLLLNFSDYQELLVNPNISGKYIFAYLFDYDLDEYKKALKLIDKLSIELNMKVILVNNTIPVNKKRIKTLIDIGPDEWLGLIKNASLVITNSFHGTAFSINFNTPFYTISKDERKDTILSMVNLTNRSISVTTGIDCIKNYKLDFSEANKLLKEKREQSLELFKGALDSCK